MSSSRPRVLVVRHEDECPVAGIESWLADVGVGCDVLPAYQGLPVPAELVDHDGLVVLGGHMGADDDADNPWLAPTRSLVAASARAGRPVLGVCLGHQLSAVALGGRVTRNPHGGTRALLPFGATDEGLTDALTSALPAGSPVVHWNDDVVVELPPSAVALATAPDGTVQAARFGERAWGVQFHPEVDLAVVRGWADGSHPVEEQAALGQLEARLSELQQPWAALVRRFGEIVSAAGLEVSAAVR
ncbi:GMP synthase (glutamine-hydrolysing) [Ornithinimicrobium humiphilum]|uniref:GMP synthase (Glutamine-hydrolysing) n=1 Tax=Ornithinimicrobium humiphilum TaxID=125288 RepID=A0A543KR59_9MICO|nr:type 1 glutamine amidotransferase [Ornithinimicrobium humiphilum]TQM97540.1 GMP synthase (glutamine-hydrolysing) [Ornithinimicrobium humiphilum]